MRMYPSFLFLVLIILISPLAVFAQKLPKDRIDALMATVADDERALEACKKSIREAQIEEFGKPLPEISGHCWSGCPTSMPKPSYPEAAKRNRFSGVVIVSAVADENGKVVYARMIKGNAIFRRSALAAAYASTYQPKMICGQRRIKFRWYITYNFRPGM